MVFASYYRSSKIKMQIKWPTGCSVSFQTGLKMCSFPFTRVLSVADSNTPVQYGIHPQCKKLESTQRAFTRYISGCQGLSYWDRLKKLGMMSLQRRRERYVILHLWKICQGAVPNDLDIQFYDHTRLGTRCKIPAMKRKSTTLSRSIYDHSFAVRGPKLWNAIPKNIKCAPSFEVFKSKLTSHLMSIIPDLPPVPGYTTPNSNSILDWNAEVTGSIPSVSQKI